MEKFTIAGVNINKVSIYELLFSRTMLFAYVLLAFGAFGIYEIILERYYMLTANAFDAGVHLGSHEVALAMKEAIFEQREEVHRQMPWTLYISNYMYMIYTGSGIIFLVALGELFGLEIIKKTAAGFLTFGLCIVFAGLFTIVFDLNFLNMTAMFKTPNVSAGMWLMLPLYCIYIPFVMFEIYLLITKQQKWVKNIGLIILLLSVVIDIAEYYIQAKLFDMNTARHLWTTYPLLPLYFIVSSFVAACGVMLLYSYIVYKNKLAGEYEKLMEILVLATLFFILVLAVYETVGFLFIDGKWAQIILFGGFNLQYYLYALLSIVIPFGLLAPVIIKDELRTIAIIAASISIIVGTYVGRFIFVYGGNAYPLSDRFGSGFEKYSEYSEVQDFIFFPPSLSEIFIVIGSVGVIFAAYKILDSIFSVSQIREH